MKTYTLEELKEIAASDAAPEARSIAVAIAYGLGRETEIKNRIATLTTLLEPPSAKEVVHPVRARVRKVLRRKS